MHTPFEVTKPRVIREVIREVRNLTEHQKTKESSGTTFSILESTKFALNMTPDSI